MTIFQYVKSFFLFGNLISIFKFIRAHSRLNKITGRNGFNPFHAKKEFNEFQRQEEIILYGFPLTISQRNTQNVLFQQIVKEQDVHNILLGQYIRKEGTLSASLSIEALIFILSTIAIACTSFIIFMCSIAVVISSVTLTAKFSIIALMLGINGYTVFQFYFRFFSTTRSFLFNVNSIRKILK